MNNTSFSIQDLCDQTGLPRRTVHFYTQQGLIPPPEGAGLGARYSEIHLLRLKVIPLLRQRGLRLDDIRKELSQRTTTDLQGILARVVTTTASISSPSSEMYYHYPLGNGITITAPQKLSASDKKKLELLLQEAQRIFITPLRPSNKE